jgi:hypothetical protein
VRPPDPAIFFAAGPLAVIFEIFGSPNVLVEIFVVVARPLRDVTFTFAHPLVNGVARSGGEQIPVAGVVSHGDELRGTSIAKRESGGV